MQDEYTTFMEMMHNDRYLYLWCVFVYWQIKKNMPVFFRFTLICYRQFQYKRKSEMQTWSKEIAGWGGVKKKWYQSIFTQKESARTNRRVKKTLITFIWRLENILFFFWFFLHSGVWTLWPTESFFRCRQKLSLRQLF